MHDSAGLSLHRSLLLATALAVTVAAGCTTPPNGLKTGGNGTAKDPKRATSLVGTGAGAASPARPPVTAITGSIRLIADSEALLVGKTRLIANNGGSIISDAGAGIISDAGAGIISNNTGGLIANNGGSLISDAGAGIISDGGAGAVSSGGSRYALKQDTPKLGIYGLADATVTFEYADGRPVLGPDGKQVAIASDKQGNFTLAGNMLTGNVIARVKLFGGGELSALVVRAKDAQGGKVVVDTASTLGAAYVLSQYVKGAQDVYDRLPASEADRLYAEFGEVNRYLVDAPTYETERLVETTDALRARSAKVNQVLEDVKALLLGQSHLGEGRLATAVPLTEPVALTAMPDGSLLLAESFLGRLRLVLPDGHITTLADAQNGVIKRNIFRINDMARGPDGTLFISQAVPGHIYKITPQNEVVLVAGVTQVGAAGPRATDLELRPQRVAVGADGTLYVGEVTSLSTARPPRVIAIAPDGTYKLLPVPDWGNGGVCGLAIEPGNTLLVFFQGGKGATEGTNDLQVHRFKDGAFTPLPTLKAIGRINDAVQAADGAYVLSRSKTKDIVRVTPDGAVTVLVAPTDVSPTLVSPDSLLFDAQGHLLFSDSARALVHRRDTNGQISTVAGTNAVNQSGDTTEFGINAPLGMTFGADNALYIAESGSHTIRRYANGQLDVIAGSAAGFGGDGGPATDALLDEPTGLLFQDGTLYIGDGGNQALRAIGSDGRIRTLVRGEGNATTVMSPGESLPLDQVTIDGPVGLARSPQGDLYWTSSNSQQLRRLVQRDGKAQIEVVAGIRAPNKVQASDLALAAEPETSDPKTRLFYPMGVAFSPDGKLYMAEGIRGRILRMDGLDGGPVTVTRVAGLGGKGTLEYLLNPDLVTGTKHDGVPATESVMAMPVCVTFDATGTMYVAEAGTVQLEALTALSDGLPEAFSSFPKIPGRVRKITPDGIITTIAGPGGKHFTDLSGENALLLPFSIALAPDGRMAIADIGTNMIRILPAGSY